MAGVNATATTMPLPLVDSGHTVLITFGYLCLLLGVIFLAYYLLKRLGFHGMGVLSSKDSPQLITRLMLGNRQSVAVVRYRDKDMVIGVTEERINLLREFEADYSDEDTVKTSGFKTFLKRGSDDEG